MEKMNIINKLHQKFVLQTIFSKGFPESYEGATPLVIEMDLTEACNLACPGCISEDLVAHNTSFSEARLLELGREFTEMGVKAVILIGGGEPLAHPAAGKLIRYLGEHDIHIGITTNGYFIDRYMEEISEYAKWTRISMDAATVDTFDKLRPGKDGKSKFQHIVDNMRQLAKCKKGTLGYSFLIRTETDGFGITSNIHEIFAAAKLAKGIGCDYFEVKPSYEYSGGIAHALVRHDSGRMEEARKEILRLASLEDDSFRIVKAINLEKSLDGVQTEQVKGYHRCLMGDLRTLICPSGVYICPYWRGKKNFRIGDAQKRSLREIWSSEQRKKIMQYVDPTVVCTFDCLRNESNLEVYAMIQQGEEIQEEVKEYDRFI